MAAREVAAEKKIAEAAEAVGEAQAQVGGGRHRHRRGGGTGTGGGGPAGLSAIPRDSTYSRTSQQMGLLTDGPNLHGIMAHES